MSKVQVYKYIVSKYLTSYYTFSTSSYYITDVYLYLICASDLTLITYNYLFKLRNLLTVSFKPSITAKVFCLRSCLRSSLTHFLHLLATGLSCLFGPSLVVLCTRQNSCYSTNIIVLHILYIVCLSETQLLQVLSPRTKAGNGLRHKFGLGQINLGGRKWIISVCSFFRLVHSCFHLEFTTGKYVWNVGMW